MTLDKEKVKDAMLFVDYERQNLARDETLMTAIEIVLEAARAWLEGQDKDKYADIIKECGG